MRLLPVLTKGTIDGIEIQNWEDMIQVFPSMQAAQMARPEIRRFLDRQLDETTIAAIGVDAAAIARFCNLAPRRNFRTTVDAWHNPTPLIAKSFVSAVQLPFAEQGGAS